MTDHKLVSRAVSDKVDLYQPHRSGEVNHLHDQAVQSLSSKNKDHADKNYKKETNEKNEKNENFHSNTHAVKHLPHLHIVGESEKVAIAKSHSYGPLKTYEKREGESRREQESQPDKEFDHKQSVNDLVKSGRIIDKSSDKGKQSSEAPDSNQERKLERQPDAKATDDKTPAKISVALQNIDGSEHLKSHFSIKENGQIVMNGNPETSKAKDIKIVLERHEGQLNPTDAQSQAADRLVRYLSERVKAGSDQARVRGLSLDDKDNVISSEVESAQRLRPKRELANFTPETRHSIEQTRRFHGSSGVDLPGASTERMGSFSTREAGRLPGESTRTMGIKEAIAGLWKPDNKEPYETARKHPDGGTRVGRYGWSGRQIEGFLKGLGEPPDPALLEKMIADGKLPKDFAEMLINPQFVAKLKALAVRLGKGEQPSSEELKMLLPKAAQEAIESIFIDQAKQQVGDRPGAIAAAMLSGKAMSEISKADAVSPEGKQLSDAGDRLYDIATRRSTNEANVVGRIPQGQKRELIEEALSKAGVAVTLANISAVNLIVQRESTWNPNIVNTWDSNARKGTPSKGLMQTIGPTFNSYSIAGHKNIFNPIDNMIAGIRYSVSRYGSLQNVPGVKAVARGGAYRGY